jgi:hypothetical protein
MRCLILFVLCISQWIAGGPVWGQSKKETAPPHKPANSRSTDSPDLQRGAKDPPILVHIEQDPQTHAGSANAENKHTSKDFYDKLGIWSAATAAACTLLLVAIGGCGVRAAIRTLKAVEDGSKAARLSAEALIISERPWLLVTIKYSDDTWIVQARNAGNTPAEIKDGHCVCKKHLLSFAGPSESLNNPFCLPMLNLIVNTDSFEIRKIKPETQITEDDREGTSAEPSLFVYGWISYWDTFTNRNAIGAKPAITQWLFRYDPATKKFCRCAGDYTKNT